MVTPIILSSAFVLALIILCLAKPNSGRIVLGLFFFVMAIGVNGSFTFRDPQAYAQYADGALFPWYRGLALSVVRVNAVLFGLTLMSFEIAMGLLLLHRRSSVRIGLIGTTALLVGIAPLSYVQLPWLGLMIAEAYLFTKEFDSSLVDIVKARLS